MIDEDYWHLENLTNLDQLPHARVQAVGVPDQVDGDDCGARARGRDPRGLSSVTEPTGSPGSPTPRCARRPRRRRQGREPRRDAASRPAVPAGFVVAVARARRVGRQRPAPCARARRRPRRRPGARRDGGRAARPSCARPTTRLGGGRVAVRSSACAEDGAEASFAGQQETYLGVEGADARLPARRRLLGVVLQRAGALLPRSDGVARRPRDGGRRAADGRGAQVAGVLFTVDPVSRRRDRMLIEAVARPRRAGRLGRGDARPLRRRPRRRRRRRERLPNGGVLTGDELAGLAALGARLERALRRPAGHRVGDRRRGDLAAAVAPGDDAVTASTASLEHRARGWIEPYWNAEHLRRTLDWLLELEPDAGEALRLAALTHDMERHFPGGPVPDLGRRPGRRHDVPRGALRALGRDRRATGSGRTAPSEELVAEAERLIVAPRGRRRRRPATCSRRPTRSRSSR